MLTSTKNNLKDYEFIGFQSAKEVCAESATCPDLEGFYFLDDETWVTTHMKNEVILELDVSSGTYQAAQDTEKNFFY